MLERFRAGVKVARNEVEIKYEGNRLARFLRFYGLEAEEQARIKSGVFYCKRSGHSEYLGVV